MSCACPDGRSGAQTCLPSGFYSECVCTAPATDAGPQAIDATRSDAGGAPVDAPASSDVVPIDAPIPDVVRQDAPASDIVTVDVGVVTTPDVTLVPDVIAPIDVGNPSCANLPTTPAQPTELRLGSSGSVRPSGWFVAFSPGGLLGIGAPRTGFPLFQVHTFDGFTRTLAGGQSGSDAVRAIRFIGEDLGLIVRWGSTSYFGMLVDASSTRSAYGYSSVGVAVEHDGSAIFYSNGGRLFRWTVESTPPGAFVTTGVDEPDSMVLNASQSALYYLRRGTNAGIYYVALRREADGSISGGMPSLYMSASSLGDPQGLAIDVCGNLYTADMRGRFLWRIPAGSAPAEAGSRLVVIASGNVGPPVFGSGSFGSTNLYFVAPSGSSVYQIPAGVEGVRQ